VKIEERGGDTMKNEEKGGGNVNSQEIGEFCDNRRNGC